MLCVKNIFFTAVFVLLFTFPPQKVLAGTCKIGDSDLRNWEFSTGASFSGAKGTTNKTDIGLHYCYEIEGEKNRFVNTGKYKFGKVDGVTNEDMWRLDLTYLQKIKSFDTSPTVESVFFNLSSFLESDEIDLISLRSGLGGGMTADFSLSPSLKAYSSVLLFWEREDFISTPVTNRATFHFGAGADKEMDGMKISVSSVFVLPPTETKDFRSESKVSFSILLAEILSLILAAGLDYENEPAGASIKKTNFAYTTSLNFFL